LNNGAILPRGSGTVNRGDDQPCGFHGLSYHRDMNRDESYRVPRDAPRQRLDRVAAAVFHGLPRVTAAHKAAKRGELRLNGDVREPGAWVEPGDEIHFAPTARKPPKVYERAIDVPFEDDHLAVVCKPPGIPVSGNLHRTLEHALSYNLGASKADDALPWPYPVHRLDARTGGLVIVAKRADTRTELGRLFQSREVHKRYRALLVGRLEGEGEVDEPLEGRRSVSRFNALQHTRSLHGEWLTTVDLYPRTGRTHQLRKHMAHLGHPILGDEKYGILGLILRGQGLFLWAVQLRFRHPESGETIDVEIDEPPKFESHRRREQRRWERRGSG